MTKRLEGWLLDLYADPQDGLALWLLEDCGGKPPGECRRLRLRQAFPVTFYAAGPPERLRSAWRYLQAQQPAPELERTERQELFQDAPLSVLAARAADPTRQAHLFAGLAKAFPTLDYYDADLPLTVRHAAAYGTFPLARLRIAVGDNAVIEELEVESSPWEIDPELPRLRVMRMIPDCDPRRRPPQSLRVEAASGVWQFSLQPPRALLVNLAALLRRYDPDLLLTQWGDTWLLPFLLEQSAALRIPLPLNRDERREALQRAERSYQAYGQVIHRGRQVQLYGRWHIDIFNAMMYHDYGLEGILEAARVTSLPVQQAARLSPGTGISAMQMITALRRGVLIPWHKQQAELPKSALELIHADQGGLVYQPVIGVHRDVAEIDFISMYPSIMARFNISPETVGKPDLCAAGAAAAETPGLVPETLRPLLDKRIALKGRIAALRQGDPRREAYRARASAHKWLLVTCFGYLGYKNARFGRIEAHQAVTAYSRECLLRAKEAAEDAGFTVLHMYIDGLWVQKPGCKTVAEVQPLLDEILERTGLPIALDGVYRWVAFLPSQSDARLPVANRYFGVFQDGSLKVRGIEARRRDTPPFIAQAQMGILERLAQAADVEQVSACLPGALDFLHRQFHLLRRRQVALEELLAAQKLSRELELYRTPSPAARAARQLAGQGKSVRPGQTVRFLYTLGEPGVHAWDCPPVPPPACLDIPRYIELLLRACAAVLQPFGFTAPALRDLLEEGAAYACPPGSLPLYSLQNAVQLDRVQIVV